MTSFLQKKAMRVQVQVDRAVLKAVRYVTIHSRGVQEEVRSKLFEVVEIAVPVADGVCEQSVLEVGVWTEDVCGSNGPMTQTGLPARVLDVTVQEYLSATLRMLWHKVCVECGPFIGKR